MRSRNAISLTLAAAALLAAGTPSVGRAFELKYLYDLATLSGNLKLDGLQVAWDPAGQELFATGYGAVRIFNPSGVQTYSFRMDLQDSGYPLGVAAAESGDLFVLANRYDGGWALYHANFRGELQGAIALRGVPAEYQRDFHPATIAHANGTVYLADLAGMRILVVDEAGAYVASYDVAEMIGFADSREDLGLAGFNVTRQGELLFTISPLFSAYVVSLDGKMRSWGKPGGAPGKFNIVAGIAADDAGRIYVVDSLKAAVIVFDASLNFIGEYGYRGRAPGRLIGPKGVATGNGKVFVAQNGQRGVTVYRIAE
jgi:DNA-binding beta-propeller fold protein YncE